MRSAGSFELDHHLRHNSRPDCASVRGSLASFGNSLAQCFEHAVSGSIFADRRQPEFFDPRINTTTKLGWAPPAVGTRQSPHF